jgi:hypothetical protein
MLGELSESDKVEWAYERLNKSWKNLKPFASSSKYALCKAFFLAFKCMD